MRRSGSKLAAVLRDDLAEMPTSDSRRLERADLLTS
jgi:hypothetical protein